MARIFLCHASEDKFHVRDVYQRLADIDGLEPWLDEEDILPGQDWDHEIRLAIRDSDFILIFFSHISVVKRGYVQREMKLALDALQEVPHGQIFAIPVRLHDCELPKPFRRYHYANLYDPQGFTRLVTALHHGLQQRGESVLALLEQPAGSRRARRRCFLAAIATIVTATALILIVQDACTSVEHVTVTVPSISMSSGEKFSMKFVEIPADEASISEPFYLGQYEVTQKQWKAVMGRKNNPSTIRGDKRPVVNVSWDEAQKFARELNNKAGYELCRLPTKTEWEYAARAGNSTDYHFGDESSQLDKYAWYKDNSGGETHPVGRKKQNDWC